MASPGVWNGFAGLPREACLVFALNGLAPRPARRRRKSIGPHTALFPLLDGEVFRILWGVVFCRRGRDRMAHFREREGENCVNPESGRTPERERDLRKRQTGLNRFLREISKNGRNIMGHMVENVSNGLKRQNDYAQVNHKMFA